MLYLCTCKQVAIVCVSCNVHQSHHQLIESYAPFPLELCSTTYKAVLRSSESTVPQYIEQCSIRTRVMLHPLKSYALQFLPQHPCEGEAVGEGLFKLLRHGME